MVAVKIEKRWWIQDIFFKIETIGLGDELVNGAILMMALRFSDLDGLVDGGSFSKRRMVSIDIVSVESRRIASS